MTRSRSSLALPPFSPLTPVGPLTRRAALAIVALAAAVGGCSSTAPAPAIASFTALPASIHSGGSSTLSWSVAGASDLSIDNGLGSVYGSSVVVTPAQTTTYTLTATGLGGVSSATAVVTVVPPGAGAHIVSFTANPTAIATGQAATLNWTVTGANALSIDQGVGDVTTLTQASVLPTADTTYTLTATDSFGGRDSMTATISVHAAGPGIDYTDPPTSVIAGKPIVLLRNSTSTPTHLIIDVKTGGASIAAAFALAMNLPLSHTLATFSAGSAGIVIPAGAPLVPGAVGSSGTTAAGAVGPVGGPLVDILTVGVARRKLSVADGDVSLPANTLLFSLGFDLVPGAAAGTLFDGTSGKLAAPAKLAVLLKERDPSGVLKVAVPSSGFAVGKLYVYQ